MDPKKKIPGEEILILPGGGGGSMDHPNPPSRSVHDLFFKYLFTWNIFEICSHCSKEKYIIKINLVFIIHVYI